MDSKVVLISILVLIILLGVSIFFYLSSLNQTTIGINQTDTPTNPPEQPEENQTTETCADLYGYECQSVSECKGDLLGIEGLCCNQPCEPEPKTCQESGGFECQDVSECEGNFLLVEGSVCCDIACIKPVDFSSCPVICPYDSLCDKSLKTDGAFNCCQNSCNYQKTQTCNFNRVCEISEDPSCLDCGCKGIVCGDICYENVERNTDCNMVTDSDIKRVLDIDINISSVEKNVWTEGQLTIKSKAKSPIQVSFGLFGERLEIDPSYSSAYQNVEIGELGEVSLPIRIRGIEVSYYNKSTLFGNQVKTLISSKLDFIGTIKILGTTESLDDISKQIFVYDQNPTSCGTNKFNLEGKCTNGVFYLDRDCSVGSECIDGLSWWFTITKEAKPKGTLKIGFLSVEGDIDVGQMTKNLQEMEDWYDMESIKYTGKDMMNIDFFYLGDFDLAADIIKDATDFNAPNNFGQSDSYKELSGSINMSAYDIIILVTDKQIKSVSGDEAGGLRVFKNIIIESNIAPQLTTHEIAHVFGCRDIYFGDLCENTFRNNLMCSKFDEFKKMDLGVCAVEMGWGDRDLDGILDIEDSTIEETAPVWLTGISIEIANTTVNRTSGEITAIGFVKDNDGGTVANYNSTFTIGGSRYTCLPYTYDFKKAFWCNLGNVNLPADMTIKVEYAGFVAEKTVPFA